MAASIELNAYTIISGTVHMSSGVALPGVRVHLCLLREAGREKEDACLNTFTQASSLGLFSFTIRNDWNARYLLRLNHETVSTLCHHFTIEQSHSLAWNTGAFKLKEKKQLHEEADGGEQARSTDKAVCPRNLENDYYMTRTSGIAQIRTEMMEGQVPSYTHKMHEQAHPEVSESGGAFSKNQSTIGTKINNTEENCFHNNGTTATLLLQSRKPPTRYGQNISQSTSNSIASCLGALLVVLSFSIIMRRRKERSYERQSKRNYCSRVCVWGLLEDQTPGLTRMLGTFERS